MLHLLQSLTISLIFLLLSSFVAQPAYAGTTFVEALTSPEQNLEKFVSGDQLVKPSQGTLGLLGTMLDATTGYLIGVRDPQTGQLITQNTAAHSLAVATGSMYSQPVSSVQYLAHLQSKIGLTKPVYAAETKGTTLLKPVITIWEAVRNASYVFFVIIFVAIGFMIMFRSKLNPQTVINVQLALPRIIMSLILITFSFAILSFLVDLAFFGNQLAANVLELTLETTSRTTGSTYHWRAFNDSDPKQGFLLVILGGFGEATVIDLIISSLTAIGGLFTGTDFNSVFLIIIAFSLIGALVKIFFALLTRHVTIILSVIGAPFVLLAGALPAQGNTTTTFLKTFFSAILTFPAILIILNLAMFFAAYADPNLKEVIPPFFLGTTSKGSPIDSMGGFIALGLLMVASKVPQVLDEIIGVKGGALSAAGAEIGGAVRKIPLIGGMLG